MVLFTQFHQDKTDLNSIWTLTPHLKMYERIKKTKQKNKQVAFIVEKYFTSILLQAKHFTKSFFFLALK